jgi:hypothetical protein
MTGQSRPVNHRSSKSFNGLGRFQPRELHKHLLRGSQLDRSTLRREFEQLHQAWPWSGLARVDPTTPQSGTQAGVRIAAIDKIVRRPSLKRRIP